MLSRDILRKVLEDWDGWYQRVRSSLIERPNRIPIPKKNALGLVGARRAGKSYMAVQTVKEIPEVLYVNFEDPAFLADFSVENLDAMVSLYVEQKRKEPSFIILDEIQNIAGWEKWVRKMVDLQRFRMIVTGSSSKMLSAELSTSLAGRVIEKTVWPLSFSEFLLFSDRTPETRDQWVAEMRFFLRWGGFPEIALMESEPDKTGQLRQYLSDIVLKDVIQRNEIRSTRSLDLILNYYFTNISSLHSYTSLKKAFGVGVDTAAQYTGFFNEAFLLFEVNRFHANLKVQARDPKKVYAVDTGLRNACSASRDHDFGKLAKNAVFIHLRRSGAQVFYFKGRGEVDFVVVDGMKAQMAIQVTFADLNEPPLYEREVGGLVECLKTVSLNEGLILTLSRKELKTVGGCKIRFTPLYEWLSVEFTPY